MSPRKVSTGRQRLIRTILGIWDSDLHPSLIAAIRTSLTDPSMLRSISEFLTLEVIGRILHTLDLPAPRPNAGPV